ncbi:hypothetical protein FO519_001780 [Halicephalobus sp. NKZ332]|nr:hypothetical protein FO519_001780 [Halicephalobus sp. NKZ332]
MQTEEIQLFGEKQMTLANSLHVTREILNLGLPDEKSEVVVRMNGEQRGFLAPAVAGCQTCKLHFECIDSFHKLPGFVDGIITYSISFDHNNCYVLRISCGEEPGISPHPAISMSNLKTRAITWAAEQIMTCREDGSWVPVGDDVFSCGVMRTFNDPAPPPANPTCRYPNPTMPPVPTKMSEMKATTFTTVTTSTSGGSTVTTSSSGGPTITTSNPAGSVVTTTTTSGPDSATFTIVGNPTPGTSFTTTSSAGNPTVFSVNSGSPTVMTVFSTDPSSSKVSATTFTTPANSTMGFTSDDISSLISNSAPETSSIPTSSFSPSSSTVDPPASTIYSSKNPSSVTKKISSPGGETEITVTSSSSSPSKTVWSTKENTKSGTVMTTLTVETVPSSNCAEEGSECTDTESCNEKDGICEGKPREEKSPEEST